MMPNATPGPGERTLYQRIGGRRKLGVLVRNFYLALAVHPALGPIFARRVENWPRHYETLTDFWALQTGGPSAYRGRLLQAHASLHLHAAHFDAWLAQWRQSCSLHFAEPEAAELIALAERLGARMGNTVADAG